MNGLHHGTIIGGCRGGFDMRDQMGSLIIAGLRQMNLIPCPSAYLAWC